MKLSKKFAGALLLGLTMVTIAAVPASAANQLRVRGMYDKEGRGIYNIRGEFDVALYKEEDEKCDPWLVEPRDSVISMRHLQWDANICKIRVTGKSKNKVEICPRREGTYYLKIKANKYIQPNDRVTVKYVVYQNGRAYNVNVKINFLRSRDVMNANVGSDSLPMRHVFDNIWLASKDGHADINVFADENLDNFRTVEADFGKNVKPGNRFIWVDVNTADLDGDGDPDFTLKKIVLVFKNGTSRRIYNKTSHSLTNVEKIKIYIKNEYEPEFYKEENCAYKGCSKLFPYDMVYTIKIKH